MDKQYILLHVSSSVEIHHDPSRNERKANGHSAESAASFLRIYVTLLLVEEISFCIENGSYPDKKLEEITNDLLVLIRYLCAAYGCKSNRIVICVQNSVLRCLSISYANNLSFFPPSFDRVFHLCRRHS